MRALGYIVPFLDIIGHSNTEISMNSTFKTNGQRYEVFVVQNNCGGYGLPIAYLYYCTVQSNLSCTSNAHVTRRTEVLELFLAALYKEGRRPTFLLLDKDIGEIQAARNAWKGIVKLQLCLFHMQQAVERKLRATQIKESSYMEDRAKEAHALHSIIDANWYVKELTIDSVFCPSHFRQEVVQFMRRHMLRHP